MTGPLRRPPALAWPRCLAGEAKVAGATLLALFVAVSAGADGVLTPDHIVEGHLCVSDELSCVDPEPFEVGTLSEGADLEIKSATPVIAFEHVSGGAYDWALTVDASLDEEFNIRSQPAFSTSSDDISKPLRIEGGAGDFDNLLFLDATERIGIRTAIPGVTLDVRGDRIRLVGAQKIIEMRTDGSATDLQATFADLYLRSITAGNNIVMNPFANDGNVGVGTTTPTAKLHVDGDAIVTGDVSLGSSRALKHGLKPVPHEEILKALLELPIYLWRYKTDPRQATHLGPMAEEMYQRFGLGRDGKHLSPADSAGVALAAIQALHGRLEDQITELRNAYSALEAEKRTLARRLELLEPEVFSRGPDATSCEPTALERKKSR